jgi:hypothetical protein
MQDLAELANRILVHRCFASIDLRNAGHCMGIVDHGGRCAVTAMQRFGR